MQQNINNKYGQNTIGRIKHNMKHQRKKKSTQQQQQQSSSTKGDSIEMFFFSMLQNKVIYRIKNVENN